MSMKKFSKTWNLDDKDEEKKYKISILWSILFGLTGIILYFLMYLIWASLPNAYMIVDEAKYQNRFIAENAYEHLKALTDIGPRVSGSVQNEIEAVGFLNKTIQKIIENADPAHRIEFDLQKAHGSFFIPFEKINYPVTSVYRGLQNVVVKVTPADNEPNNYLLLNAHFDTVPTSPGAGDDATMCAVMLEIMRKITQKNETFKHGLVFLFNGLEENTLQASHAFISHHRWFPKIRAVINLEGASSGGRELMFQAGPEFPFLMKYYSKYIHHPFCNAVAEEVFQAGLIPSRTDYENFVNFGKIPGMDFAFNSHGYLYHTKYDAIDSVPLETLQHTGDNILDLTKALANAKELFDIERYRGGKAIFFDMFNWFMVYYTSVQATIIHSFMIVASLAVLVGSFMMMCKQEELERKKLAFEFAMSLVVQLASVGIGMGFTLLLAVIIDTTGRSMSWFSSTWLMFGLYFCPFLMIMCLGPLLYIKWRELENVNLQIRVLLFLHAQFAIYILVLLVLTCLGMQTSYILFIFTAFYSISTIVNMSTQNRKFHWIYIHVIGQIIPFVYMCSAILLLFTTFIPMTGRGDSEANPDLLMGLFSVIASIALFSFFTPLVSLLRKPFYLIGFIGLFWISTLIIMATPVGFPYREATSPQRYYIYHMERQFYDMNGTIRKEDSKIFLHRQDRNNPKYIMKHVPEMKNSTLVGDECDHELYCGLPYYLNRNQQQARSSHWLPAEKPTFSILTRFEKMNKAKVSQNITRYDFTVSGPDHMGLYLSPVKDVKIKSWTFSDKIPVSAVKWNDQDVHFVNLVYGSDTPTYQFYIEIEHSSNRDPKLPSFILALVGQYMHHDNERTKEFSNFISHFPKFAHVVAYQSYYENRVF